MQGREGSQVGDGPRDVALFTDGGCIGNPGPGGWGAVLLRRGRYYEYGGAEGQTTNNRMELRAAIEGLRHVEAGEQVTVTTDSRYVHDGISKWIRGWKRRGWKKADGQPVLNRDLWEELDAQCGRSGAVVHWAHVRGHTGHLWNERCDAIANAFARGQEPVLGEGAVSDLDPEGGEGSPAAGRARPAEQRRRRAGGAPAPRTEAGYPVYLSLLGGEVRAHPSWAECEAHVRGVSGARYKKVKNAAERAEVLRRWGVRQ